MILAKRQKQILDRIIEEYIESAQPVSSRLLEERYNLGICPATIRLEMQKLTDNGYLFQPHTSAGRIPTDKGYRFFVDSILELNFKDFYSKKLFGELEEIEKETQDILKLIQSVTRTLAEASSNLALNYLLEKDFFWKDGWIEIFQEPEFRDFDYSFRFVKMVDSFEKEIKSLILSNLSKPKIYIGRENPIRLAKDFSVVLSRYSLPMARQSGVLAILGPKRMDFAKNISLINAVVKLLENY